MANDADFIASELEPEHKAALYSLSRFLQWYAYGGSPTEDDVTTAICVLLRKGLLPELPRAFDGRIEQLRKDLDLGGSDDG